MYFRYDFLEWVTFIWWVSFKVLSQEYLQKKKKKNTENHTGSWALEIPFEEIQ